MELGFAKGSRVLNSYSLLGHKGQAMSASWSPTYYTNKNVLSW